MAKSLLNQLFDKIYCINLDKRKDRWQEMKVVFTKYGIAVERFSAIPGNAMGWQSDSYPDYRIQVFEGECGCTASHLSIYKLAKQNNYESILILEDDCDFENDFIDLFSKIYMGVPDDWDLLYFGGVHETLDGQLLPEYISPHVVLGKRIFTTNCYAVKNTVYDLIINAIEKDLPCPEAPIDMYLASEVQPNCRTYAFHPPIAWQRSSYSDIQLKYSDSPSTTKYNNII